MERPSTQLIRVATGEHWRAYHRIRRQVLFEARGRYGIYDENHPDENREGHHPLLLVASDEPIGTARLDDRLNGLGIVRLVAIASERQRQGFGRALMTKLEHYAMQRGIDRVEANVAADAVGFYRRLGWSIRSDERDNPVMVKSLSPRMPE